MKHFWSISRLGVSEHQALVDFVYQSILSTYSFSSFYNFCTVAYLFYHASYISEISCYYYQIIEFFNRFFYHFKDDGLTRTKFKNEFSSRYYPTTDFEIRQCSARYNACTQGRNNVNKYIKDFEQLRSISAYDYESEKAMRKRCIFVTYS